MAGTKKATAIANEYKKNLGKLIHYVQALELELGERTNPVYGEEEDAF